MLPYHVIHAIK